MKTVKKKAPKPPSPPPGTCLVGVVFYAWSDPPRFEAWAEDTLGDLLVSILDPTTNRWGPWFRNAPAFP